LLQKIQTEIAGVNKEDYINNYFFFLQEGYVLNDSWWLCGEGSLPFGATWQSEGWEQSS